MATNLETINCSILISWKATQHNSHNYKRHIKRNLLWTQNRCWTRYWTHTAPGSNTEFISFLELTVIPGRSWNWHLHISLKFTTFLSFQYRLHGCMKSIVQDGRKKKAEQRAIVVCTVTQSMSRVVSLQSTDCLSYTVRRRRTVKSKS